MNKKKELYTTPYIGFNNTFFSVTSKSVALDAMKLIKIDLWLHYILSLPLI